MPDLAQIFGAGSSDPSRGLLFYENIGFPVEKMEFWPFSQSWGKREIFKGLRTGEDVTQGPCLSCCLLKFYMKKQGTRGRNS